jgi:hypothetical protein
MKVAFWLLPRDRDRLMYQALIDQLAETYDTARFAAHVTIDVEPYDGIDLKACIQTAIADLQPFSLTIDRLDYTPHYTKTLFVQFHPHPLLTQVSDRLRSQFKPPADFSLNPHLSLIYGGLQPDQQQRLAQEIVLPATEVWFDGISAIGFTASSTRQDIEQAELLYQSLF